jgi:hypothetical protein
MSELAAKFEAMTIQMAAIAAAVTQPLEINLCKQRGANLDIALHQGTALGWDSLDHMK